MVVQFSKKKPALKRFGQTQSDAEQAYDEWLADKVIGKPKATDDHSTEELMKMGIFGVYKRTVISVRQEMGWDDDTKT